MPGSPALWAQATRIFAIGVLCSVAPALVEASCAAYNDTVNNYQTDCVSDSQNCWFCEFGPRYYCYALGNATCDSLRTGAGASCAQFSCNTGNSDVGAAVALAIVVIVIIVVVVVCCCVLAVVIAVVIVRRRRRMSMAVPMAQPVLNGGYPMPMPMQLQYPPTYGPPGVMYSAAPLPPSYDQALQLPPAGALPSVQPSPSEDAAADVHGQPQPSKYTFTTPIEEDL